MLAPGNGRVSGRSPGFNPASKTAEPRSGDSFRTVTFNTAEMDYETCYFMCSKPCIELYITVE